MSSLLRVIFDPDTIPPSVPTILSVTAVGQNRLDIAWSVSTDTGGSGLAGYDLLKDGATVISLGIQTTYSDTGLTASSSHTYRVRSRDSAGNVSAYSSQVGGTTAAAPAAFNPDYPRRASYAIGGTQNSTNAALAERCVAIFGYGATWAQRKGVTLEAKASAVKSLSTVGTKMVPYVIHVDVSDAFAATNNDFYEWYTALTTNQWFVYNNGVTHDTKIVGSGSGYSKPNYTTACPVVSGDTAFTWKAKWDYRLLYTGGVFNNGVTNVTVQGTSSLDGKYDDNIFIRERSAGDYNVDGVSESVSSTANINLIQSSHAANLAYWKTLAPANTLALCNFADWPAYGQASMSGTPLDQLYDGGVHENITEYLDGPRGTTAASLLNAIKLCYDACTGPKLVILRLQLASATDYARLRLWDAIAALTGSCLYEHVNSGYLAEELGTINWDERTFRLGQPSAGAAGAVQWTAQAGGHYRRDFVNGIVLANLSTSPITASLGGTFYRLLGTLDSTTNNGQAVTSVTLPAKSGLFLARVSQDTVAPSVPASPSASAVSSSQINLVWNASTDTGGSGLAGYQIERSLNGTSGWTQIQQQTGTTYTDSSLSASTQYFYRIRAYDVVGNQSGYSTTVNATTTASTGGLAFPLPSTNWVAAKGAMSLIYPRPDPETASYAYHKKAYFDGVNAREYRVPLGVRLGAPPYRFTLQQGPPGMTVGRYWGDTNYSIVTWTPQAAVTNAPVSILVESQDLTQLTISWTVSTSSSLSDFIFVDILNGSDSNTGAINSKLKTATKVFGASQSQSTYPNARVFFEPGTYDVPNSTGSPSGAKITPNLKPMSWIASTPHSVIFRCATGGSSCAIGTDTGCNDLFWDGIDLDNQGVVSTNYKSVWMGGVSHRCTVTRCNILNPYNGSTGGDVTTGWFFDSPGTGVYRQYLYFCDFSESGRNGTGGNAYSFLTTYVCQNGLLERFTISSSATQDVYLKASTRDFTCRYFSVKNTGTAGTGAAMATGEQVDASLPNLGYEYCYGTIDSPNYGALTFNYGYNTPGTTHWAYRLSIRGRIWMRGGVGPVTIENCAIQNSTTDPGGGNAQISTQSPPSPIYTNTGTECQAASGVFDTNILLTGAYRTNYLGKRGAEIA